MSDTTPIILAVIGTGVTLLGILAGLLISLFRILRQDMAALRQEIKETNTRVDSMASTLNARIDALRQELRTDIAALHARIDALYQALFNHKDRAAGGPSPSL